MERTVGGVFPVLEGWRYSRYLLPLVSPAATPYYHRLTDRLPGWTTTTTTTTYYLLRFLHNGREDLFSTGHTYFSAKLKGVRYTVRWLLSYCIIIIRVRMIIIVIIFTGRARARIISY